MLTMDPIADEPELVRFRFELTDERIVAVPIKTFRRFQRFVWPSISFFDRDVTYEAHDEAAGPGRPWIARQHDAPHNLEIITGELAQPQVTAIQALAMGHDLESVLDMLGAPRLGEDPERPTR